MYMYVCMQVCMYVCMYPSILSMYVSISVCIYLYLYITYIYIYIYKLVVSEAPRDHAKEHPYSREHPAAAGFASRAVRFPPYGYIHTCICIYISIYISIYLYIYIYITAAPSLTEYIDRERLIYG